MEDKKEYTADDFLRSVRVTRIEVRRCEARLAELRSQCEKVTAGYGPMTPGGSGDLHRDSLLIELAEQTNELYDSIRRLLEWGRMVETFIGTLPDEKQRTVLRLRYVDSLGWKRVQTEMQGYGFYYEERQVYRLHGAALAEARRRFPVFAEKHPEILPKEDDVA